MNQNTKALVLDVDGMVNLGKRFSQRFDEVFGISTDVTRDFFNGPFQDCLVGKADLMEELGKVVVNWGWKGNIDDIVTFWFDGENNLNKDMLEYVQQLRQNGLPCYIGTNNEKYRTQYLIENMKLGDLFDKVYSSSHIGYRKPDKEFYQHIVDDAGLGQDGIIFWDDDHDQVEAAKNFGFQAELYKGFDDFKNNVVESGLL